MKCFLIPMQVLIVEVRVFIEPHGQTKGLPATHFVQNNLPAFEFKLIGHAQAATPPDGQRLLVLAPNKIRPENSSGGLELRGVKQKLGINDRHVI